MLKLHFVSPCRKGSTAVSGTCYPLLIKTHDSVLCDQIQPAWACDRQVCIIQEPRKYHLHASVITSIKPERNYVFLWKVPRGRTCSIPIFRWITPSKSVLYSYIFLLNFLLFAHLRKIMITRVCFSCWISLKIWRAVRTYQAQLQSNFCTDRMKNKEIWLIFKIFKFDFWECIESKSFKGIAWKSVWRWSN